ncbi:DUF4136 domain-containing protein [Ketobacter alkanivorans]|nr:DUF4136 domain-containing protein [Ketobacter alkanivorans]
MQINQLWHRAVAITLPALAAAVLLLNSGCVTVEEPIDKINPALRQSSVVSTNAPEFSPQRGETVAWRGDITVHAPEGQAVPDALVADLKAKIDTQLVAKGYRFTQIGEQPDYLMHGIIVLGNELNENQLRDVLGFEPGLVTHGQKYEKGSLLLMLVDPNSYSTDWRAVVQVFTSQELSPEERDHRFDYIIRSLLRPLPDLKG